jgi:hypothetical protein
MRRGVTVGQGLGQGIDEGIARSNQMFMIFKVCHLPVQILFSLVATIFFRPFHAENDRTIWFPRLYQR